MWYAVRVTFIDGNLFEKKVVSPDEDERNPVGKCYCSHDEEPRNSMKKECDGRIEINVYWFETMDLARRFCNGEITYKHTYEVYYKKEIKSHLSRFVKREIVDVNAECGIYPYEGVYEEIELNYKPYWVR